MSTKDEPFFLEAASVLREAATKLAYGHPLEGGDVPRVFATTEIVTPKDGRTVRLDVRIEVRTAPIYEAKTDEEGKPVRAVARQDALDALTRSDRYDRLRNYEIERKLEDLFGGDWVVWEACPWKGEYCAWGRATGRRPPISDPTESPP